MDDNTGTMSTGKSIALFLLVLVGGAVLVSIALYFVLANFNNNNANPLVGRWQTQPVDEYSETFLIFEFSDDGLWSLSFNNTNGDLEAYGEYVFSHERVVLIYSNGRKEVFRNVRIQDDQLFIWGEERPPFLRTSYNTYIAVASLLEPNYDIDPNYPEETPPPTVAEYLYFTVSYYNIRFRGINDLWNEMHYSLTIEGSKEVPNRVDIDINLYNEDGEFMYTLPLENSIHRGATTVTNTNSRLFENEMGIPAYGIIIIRGRDVEETIIRFNFDGERAVLEEE